MSENFFTCEPCDKTFKRNQHYQRHLNTSKHKDKLIQVVSESERIISDGTEITQNSSDINEEVENELNVLYAQITAKHLKSLNKMPKKSTIVKVVNNDFHTNKNEKYESINNTPSDEKDIFIKLDKDEKEISTENNKNKYFCDYCSYVTDVKCNWVKHKNTHFDPPTSEKCKICNIRYNPQYDHFNKSKFHFTKVRDDYVFFNRKKIINKFMNDPVTKELFDHRQYKKLYRYMHTWASINL